MYMKIITFCFIPNATETKLRNRQKVNSLSLRKPEMISSEEIACGTTEIVKANLGATEEEIVTGVSRMIGFKSTSSSLKKTISEVVAQQLAHGQLRRNGDLITIAESEETQKAI